MSWHTVLAEIETIGADVLDAMGLGELATLEKSVVGLAEAIVAAVQRKKSVLAVEVQAADAAAEAAVAAKFGDK